MNRKRRADLIDDIKSIRNHYIDLSSSIFMTLSVHLTPHSPMGTITNTVCVMDFTRRMISVVEPSGAVSAMKECLHRSWMRANI